VGAKEDEHPFPADSPHCFGCCLRQSGDVSRMLRVRADLGYMEGAARPG
jgi:hypothetical protein